MAARASLSLAEARRVAIAAQGLASPPPMSPPPLSTALTSTVSSTPSSAPGMRQLSSVVERIGLLQIDSVNVLSRAQYLPLFSRLGPYDRGLLDRAAGQAPRRLVEVWAHEASFVPPQTHRLLRWRMARWRDVSWAGIRTFADEHGPLMAAVRAEVADRGPMTTRQIEAALAAESVRSFDNWGWNWSLVKHALEALFWSGDLTSAGRTAQFERRYDVPERVLPPTFRDAPTLSDDDSFLELIRIAARAHGVATLQDLRDYFRMSVLDTRTAVAALVDSGELLAVTVEGWARPAYLWHAARVPRVVDGAALLAPFDPLVWERARVEALFGMRYRIEIYVPQALRVHGYYVLPFLYGDRLVARVDLKADRSAATLLVRSAWAEPQLPPGAVAALADHLRSMATWLGLSAVTVEPLGDLAGRLAAAFGGGGRRSGHPVGEQRSVT